MQKKQNKTISEPAASRSVKIKFHQLQLVKAGQPVGAAGRTNGNGQ